eukprot:CAMPEP_0174706482 /NCGR_PEP_ID=MMETSP1094-20130205/9314_1 /TAXON_ID=156173 /ORGANISM="Chrysochromulina brevifilum, Strain UTEX LB 985" /LENGTH=203 /DNA_ID=CAMNT_0015904749 /DNA_START=204 /DNA_END=812 /DNA_ORIENTATION=+
MLHVGCATNAAQSDEQGRTPLNTRSRRTHRTVSNGAGRACGDWHVTSRGLLVDVSSNLHTWCPPVKRLKASGPADTCLAVARSTSCDEGEAEADLASIVHLLLGCIQAGKLVALFPPLLSGGSYLGCCRSAAAVRALQFGFSRRGRLNCVRGQRFHPKPIEESDSIPLFQAHLNPCTDTLTIEVSAIGRPVDNVRPGRVEANL